MELRISRVALDEILSAAAASPGAEICGLLFGRTSARGAVVTGLRPCANVAANPRDSFEVDPAALIAAHRAARAGGPALVGHYHSHPGGSPDPSARDAAAAEPGGYWIIAGGGTLRAWYADGRQADGRGRFRAVTIVEADNR
ncbi:M67 family metallopeptidase [Sphingomonas sp. C8-2]|jgi:proteasome lid subunit RPN8/RPN11|uniref:M67 family metallopeptidase n=1 Tax=Rhizorhabdus histidinilytica TaxID=439228 RepID=UPI000F783B31|nr:M67 family metallopeptidase [Sphingomonas sp. C8-2]